MDTQLHAAATAALGWIDEIYPPNIFDGSSGDEGPVRIVEIRENLRLALAPHAVGEWQPLSDGMYYDVEVAHNGSELSMIAVDAHDLEWPTETDLPPDIRLCRYTVPQAERTPTLPE